MHLLTASLLVLTLLLCGSYAGMCLMCQIGVLPAMRRLSLHAYADAWRAMDYHLDRSMPPFKLSLLLINLAALILLLIQHRAALAAACGISFLLSLAALVLTLRLQLPLNAALKALPADAPEATLLQIREQTVRNFGVRFILAAIAFVVLGCGCVFFPF